jgi:kumamolisin
MNTPFAKPHFLLRNPNIKRPHAASQSYAPGQLPAAYNMPTGMAVIGQTIVIGELGGAFYPNDIPIWAAKAGMPVPKVTTHLLTGADDSSSDADGEVALDWQKAAEFYSYITGEAASIVIVYGPNSGSAFADVMNYANSLANVGSGSWSWGSPENQWAVGERGGVDAAAQGSKFSWSAASGDNDANDGTNAPDTDYPASSPYVIGCGGTSRVPAGGSETVWNNGNGEGTGGGFSKVYGEPSWQPSNSQGTGRMVPDIAMVADPDTGHDVVINGQWQVIGGTSAVAPMMAGFMAAVNGVRAKNGLAPASQANALLWGNASSFFDITSGNNGAYSASPGPDPCSGLGRPLPTLFAALTGATSTPPPVNPPPVNPPPVQPPTGVQATVQAVVSALEAAGWPQWELVAYRPIIRMLAQRGLTAQQILALFGV